MTAADVDSHVTDPEAVAAYVADLRSAGRTEEEIAEWLVTDIEADGTPCLTAAVARWIRRRLPRPA